MDTTELWSGYLKVAAPMIVGYYGWVIYRFYRQELKSFWTGNGGRAPTEEVIPAQPNENAYAAANDMQAGLHHDSEEEEVVPQFWQSEETFRRAEDLAAYLKEAIAEAYEKNYDRQELILLLQMTIRDYQDLERTPFQFAINNLIETECAKYGRVHLRAEDLEQVWEKVG